MTTVSSIWTSIQSPHFGEESELQSHWAGARNKRMKEALTLFAQDAESKLILYTATDINKDEADDQVLEFLSFWKSVKRGVKPTLIFDSKFTTYSYLSQLSGQGVREIVNTISLRHVSLWQPLYYRALLFWLFRSPYQGKDGTLFWIILPDGFDQGAD